MVDLSGDLCVQLAESGSSPTPHWWQTRLQDLHGGTCTFPVHVTLQRIAADTAPTSTVLASVARNALESVPMLRIQSDVVQPRFSGFRSGWILKLLVAGNLALMQARALLERTLASRSLQGVIPPLPTGGAIPVTVLESIVAPSQEPESAGDPPHVSLPDPVEVFLDTVIVSCVRGPFDYEMIDTWSLAEG